MAGAISGDWYSGRMLEAGKCAPPSISLMKRNNTGKALDTLVQLDRDNKLLSRDIAVVDLRLPDRVTVRLSDEAAAARIEALKAKNPKKKGGAA